MSSIPAFCMSACLVYGTAARRLRLMKQVVRVSLSGCGCGGLVCNGPSPACFSGFLGWLPTGGGCGKLPHGPSDPLVGYGKIELRLKIQPKLGINTEPVAKPQGSVAGYGASPGDNLADAVGWDFIRRAKAVEVAPNSASSSLRISPGCTARLNISSCLFHQNPYPRR